MVVGGWFWVVVGWWLVVGGWWLVVGGCWLEVGGWWLLVDGCWFVLGVWWLVVVVVVVDVGDVNITQTISSLCDSDELTSPFNLTVKDGHV